MIIGIGIVVSIRTILTVFFTVGMNIAALILAISMIIT